MSSDALKQYTQRIKESQPLLLNSSPNADGQGDPRFGHVNGIALTPAVTLYTNSSESPDQRSSTDIKPPSPPNPTPQTKTSQPSAPLLNDSGPDTKKAPPSVTTHSTATPQSAIRPQSAGANTTSNAVSHLKRKSQPSNESTSGGDTHPPPAKRTARKRGKTGGG